MIRRYEKDESIVFSVSNNYEKGLKRAKVIINFDYDISFFKKFNINKNAVIINLATKKLDVDSEFKNFVIEDLKMKCNKNFLYNNFSKNVMYESEILNLRYYQILEKCKEDNFLIETLLSSNY